MVIPPSMTGILLTRFLFPYWVDEFLPYRMVGGWNQPIWNTSSSNWEWSVVKVPKKYVRNHQLDKGSGQISIIPKPELRGANPSHSSTPAMTARWNWSVQRLDVSHMSFVKLSKWNTYQNSSTNLAVSFTNLSHLLSRRVWFELSLLPMIIQSQVICQCRLNLGSHINWIHL